MALSVQELMKYSCELFAFIWRSFDIDEQGRDQCHHIYYLQWHQERAQSSDHLGSSKSCRNHFPFWPSPKLTWKGNDPYTIHRKDTSAFPLSLANCLARIGETFQCREAIRSIWHKKVYSVHIYFVLTYHTILAKVETNELLFIVLLFPLLHGQSKPQTPVASYFLSVKSVRTRQTFYLDVKRYFKIPKWVAIFSWLFFFFFFPFNLIRSFLFVSGAQRANITQVLILGLDFKEL